MDAAVNLDANALQNDAIRIAPSPVKPGDPTQGPLDEAPWFETVSIQHNPFEQGDEAWFGFVAR